MEPKEKALQAVTLLEEAYPEAICSLVYTDPLQLLIATRLAAQCTDKRVNMVTPALFERFPTVEAFADADIAEVESLIKTCGLYKTKCAGNSVRITTVSYRIPLKRSLPYPVSAAKQPISLSAISSNSLPLSWILIVSALRDGLAFIRARMPPKVKNYCVICCRLTVPTISVTVWYCTDVRSARPVILNAMPAVCKVFVSMPQTIHKIHSMMPQ